MITIQKAFEIIERNRKFSIIKFRSQTMNEPLNLIVSDSEFTSIQSAINFAHSFNPDLTKPNSVAINISIEKNCTGDDTISISGFKTDSKKYITIKAKEQESTRHKPWDIGPTTFYNCYMLGNNKYEKSN